MVPFKKVKPATMHGNNQLEYLRHEGCRIQYPDEALELCGETLMF